MIEIDDFDRRILMELQDDATQSTSEIAEKVGLSQAPCWRRIQKIKEAGLIKSQVALLDRRKLGFQTQIFAEVKLSATGRTNVDAFTAAIRDFPEVMECFVVLGSVDFLLRIVARDIEAYERFFFDKLSVAPGVQEVHSTVALSEIKSSTALPL
jgi:Lrp/AsnC family transcriptional regulator